MAQQYDVTLKLLLDRKDGAVFPLLFGGPVDEWRNIEAPKVENKRLDLLARRGSELFYLEIDSQCDMDLPNRLARNAYLLKERSPGQVIRPVVMYVGARPPRMPCPYVTELGAFEYRLVNMRDGDGEALVASPDIRDNMIAILTGADTERVIGRVTERLAGMAGQFRDDTALQFTILSELRGLSQRVRERIHLMVTLNDLLDSPVFGPVFHDHERMLVRALLEYKFGPLPPAARDKLDRAGKAELDRIHFAVLSARDVDEAFVLAAK